MIITESSLKRWDKRFIDLAAHVATWSKDLSTQVGAVIAHEKRLVSVGFNGFAQNVEDSRERLTNRDIKYLLTIHAEINAINFARMPMDGCTIYVYPFPPCARCASQIIQAGINRVVAPKIPQELIERWGDETKLSKTILVEAGIIYSEYEDCASYSL